MTPSSAPSAPRAPSTTGTAMRLSDLTVRFGGLTALSGISLEVEPGEVVGIIGPNGAGKTTLFNVLSGITRPESGTLSLGGQERPWPKSHELPKLGIARTLQGVGLFEELTVLENVMVGRSGVSRPNFFASLLGSDGKYEAARREEALNVIEMLEISEYSGRITSSLPYPISKRVAIARALVARPQILLLDEPAGGLGSEDIEWLNRLIFELKKEMSILLVEHHMDVIMNVCDRVYVLNFGSLIASGTPTEVRNNQDVIDAYLGLGSEQ